jgi:sugar lactone lactonase YvrE
LRGLLVGSAILFMCSALAGAASGRAGAGSSGEASRSGLARTEAVVREVRTLESDRIGTTSPVGLAFASSNESFYLTSAPKQIAPPDTAIARLKPFALRRNTDRVGSTKVAASVRNRINIAFDDVRDRLLLLREDGRRLYAIQANADGSLDPTSLVRYDVSRFGLGHPEGMAVDPASGAIFILDASGPRIARLEPGSDGGFADADVSSIDLAPSGATNVRGIAFDPSSGHLHVHAEGGKLYELTTGGQTVAVRDLSGITLGTPQAMVFAPSGDLTDSPDEQSIYMADSGGSGQALGQIVELSLTAAVAPAASSFSSSLVHTVDTAAWDKPSPDPSGLAYLSGKNRIMVTDGEVEETKGGITHFEGANVWEMTFGGNVLRTANVSKVQPTVVPMSDEPTGVAYDPALDLYYFSDDGPKVVFRLNPGADDVVGTADDSWNSFGVSGFGDGDPEGIAYDTAHDRIFVADGVNAEVYQYTTTGSLVGHFDVAAFGVQDPETVEFNPVSGTLFVLSNRPSGPIVVETSLNGTLIQTINVAAAGARKPAGLAYAPASDGSGDLHFYIADRGIDNDSHPEENDGKIYELTAPQTGTPNQDPTITSAGGGATASKSVPENQTAVTDVDATDPDSDPLTYSLEGGADDSDFTINQTSGVLSFTTPPDFEAPGDANTDNVYEVTVAVSDGRGGSDSQQISVTVTDVVEAPNQHPMISSDGGGATASKSVPENQTAVTDVDATDPDSDPLTYSLGGGADDSDFTINQTSGVLSFTTPPDFEAPGDANTDNVYEVTVAVSDGRGGSDSQQISVTVTNMDDTSSFTFSLRDAATVGGVSVANEDIVSYDGAGHFSLAFDGSDVGLAAYRIDGFAWLDSDTLLLSVDTDRTNILPGMTGPIDDSDVVRFNASSLGATTAGTFSMYFDGSDVGLTQSAADVDALELLADGRIVISTTGTVSVSGVSARDEDLLAFTPASLGQTTAGTFALYFDGSDVGLGENPEDVDAVSVDASGRLFLSTADTFAVPGLSGADEDVFVFNPTQLGPTTAGTYLPSLFFDGSSSGLAANDVFGIDVP